jgi:hypothetical protein
MKEPSPFRSNLALAVLIVFLAMLFGWLLSAMPAKAAAPHERVLNNARMRCHVEHQHGKRVKVCKLQQPPARPISPRLKGTS